MKTTLHTALTPRFLEKTRNGQDESQTFYGAEPTDLVKHLHFRDEGQSWDGKPDFLLAKTPGEASIWGDGGNLLVGRRAWAFCSL